MTPHHAPSLAISVLVLASSAALGCSGDLGDGGTGGSGAQGATAGSMAVGPGNGSGTNATGATSGNAATASSSSGTTMTGQPCSPDCTGSKLCDDSGACVCAPGFVFDGTDCTASPVSDPTTRSKDEVCARLADATIPPAMQWVPGNGDACDPGTVPFDAQVATLKYLNFYRWMIGVGPVQVDPSVAVAEQQCAVMLNYYFGHDPTPDVMCYTPEGAQACGDSLIAGGFGLVGQIDGYALETGQNFIHHRNVLSVGRAGVWFGANGSSSDMHYGGAYPALASDPAFVAHPGPGPQVMSKVPVNWWFVENGTATTPPLDAKVTDTSTGTDMPMTRQHHFDGFSSFETNGWTPVPDTTYHVQLIDDSSAVFGEYDTSFVNCP